MNFHALLRACNGGHGVGCRPWLGVFLFAAMVIGSTVTAAYALDECSGVTGCVSVPDTESRVIPSNDSATFDLSCPPIDAPYLWNWHVVGGGHQTGADGMRAGRRKPARSSQTIDVSLIKIYKNESGQDTGVRLRIDDSDHRSAAVLIKLGCSTQPFPYANAGRKTAMSIRPGRPQ
jgi:hypothetical protein